MAILSTIKKGYLLIKTATGYVKLLPRTLATLVSMADGSTVESQITALKGSVSELNSKIMQSLIVSKTKVTEGQNIAFNSNAKELIIWLFTGNTNKTSIRIPNNVVPETYILIAVWATGTTSRIHFKRTATGISILSSYGEGLWQDASRNIEIYGIG